MNSLAFTKMHGLGNDFVVIDARDMNLHLDGAQVRAIADRKTGVGCDQLIVVGAPPNGREARGGADVFMTILNADGGEVEACGNATRCVAAALMAENGAAEAAIETVAGVLRATDAGDGRIAVDMGPALDGWQDIPLAEARDTLHLGIAEGPLRDPVAVSVGNPHAVFFVDDVESVAMETHGPLIENHPLFPRRINVEAAQILSPERIRMRVWERGVGVTRACGTGACATLVAAHRRGLTGRRAEVVLDGGTLDIAWREDGHVIMTGPAAISFSGILDPSLLEGA
jgi:diaminopimelate epimerase